MLFLCKNYANQKYKAFSTSGKPRHCQSFAYVNFFGTDEDELNVRNYYMHLGKITFLPKNFHQIIVTITFSFFTIYMVFTQRIHLSKFLTCPIARKTLYEKGLFKGTSL